MPEPAGTAAANIALKKILILVDWFYPGYKAGGPIQSCRNFVASMEDEYELYVLASDRDLGDDQPYVGIKLNQWNDYSANTKVFYASNLSLNQLRDITDDVAPDYVYINSMFSPRFAIYPLLLKRLGKLKSRVILSPRGMLKKSALSFKPVKKNIFLFLLRLFSIQKKIHFHATDNTEAADITRLMGDTTPVTCISNFPGSQKVFNASKNKISGKLSMIFVGRIHPIKNLHLVLQCLSAVKASIQFTIVAAIEDQEYWKGCKLLIGKLPANIEVTMKEHVPHDQMNDIIGGHHLFVLPTQGENFGHAIFESLSAGRPVLISDQTPWKQLSGHKAGWDIPLNEPYRFTEVIEQVAAMDNEEHLAWCKGAWQYCHDFIENSGIKQQYLKLFN